MAANTRARLQNIDPRVAICKANQLPYVDPQFVANHRQLIRKGNIGIAETIFGQFAHFSGTRIRDDTFAFDENLVQRRRCLRALWRHTANNPIILNQLSQNMTGQDALRTMRNTNVRCLTMGLRERKVRASLGQPCRHLLGSTNRGGGLKNYQVTRFEYRCNTPTRRLNIL
ncbi:hypothetical protein D3C78_1373050 [compost metagenome]